MIGMDQGCTDLEAVALQGTVFYGMIYLIFCERHSFKLWLLHDL